jgi:hypothetical protein
MDGKQIINVLITLVFALAVYPLIFMLVWNNVVIDLVAVKEITFWQSFFLGLGIRAINGTPGIKRNLQEIKQHFSI